MAKEMTEFNNRLDKLAEYRLYYILPLHVKNLFFIFMQ